MASLVRLLKTGVPYISPGRNGALCIMYPSLKCRNWFRHYKVKETSLLSSLIVSLRRKPCLYQIHQSRPEITSQHGLSEQTQVSGWIRRRLNSRDLAQLFPQNSHLYWFIPPAVAHKFLSSVIRKFTQLDKHKKTICTWSSVAIDQCSFSKYLFQRPIINIITFMRD